ncbi:peptidylprolyl isomerase [archaeon]|jgi:FKBP-type peptidyl-prolyl cis-trans isomerase 2|nr:peptidylprolyl isomerase [archaeon]MBT6823863.1 peptidylprolyl isomerase [archaeon]MBT7107394.1 peptidylprolyl isomerase [archaeon]MBT7297212.1 peptidylprolyl isomerase [archaeon]
MNAKKKDFIKVEYTGRIKTSKKIFDLTDETLAKKENIHNPNLSYGPRIVCIGEGHLLKGLDDKLEGKEIGKSYDIELDPESAFGVKNPKLIKILSMKQFKKHNLNPSPGLRINVDNHIGVIRSVSAGRVIVDFNHPLAGQAITYEIKLIESVNNTEEQVKSLVNLNLFLNEGDYDLKLVDGKLEILSKLEIPEPIVKNFEKNIKELISKISAVSVGVRPKKEAEKTEK